LILGALERFGGYTFETLMAEDSELLQLLAIEEMGGSRELERY
jgi:hypothetical protein